MSSRRLQDMSRGRLQDMSSSRVPEVLETNKMFTGKGSISLLNKYKSVSGKSLYNKPISTKLKQIQGKSKMH